MDKAMIMLAAALRQRLAPAGACSRIVGGADSTARSA
jgi:hypothetical protein